MSLAQDPRPVVIGGPDPRPAMIGGPDQRPVMIGGPDPLPVMIGWPTFGVPRRAFRDCGPGRGCGSRCH